LGAWVYKFRVQPDIAIAPVVAKHLHDFGAGYALWAGNGGIGVPANNEIVAGVRDASNIGVVLSGGDISLATWTHLAMTWDGATRTLRLFKDGALVASGSNAATGAIDPAGDIFRIGSYNRTSLSRVETFPGLLDEVTYF